VTKILAKKLYRFIRFFSQKLCICIALNDTFLSIAAHHWLPVLGQLLSCVITVRVSGFILILEENR
jgi:hypothetical protein